LDVDELQKLKPSGKVHQSKFKGTYQLVDILWNKNDKRQGELNGI
jgi:muramidase (phage lysozyme)